jgi:hypothetical protein
MSLFDPLKLALLFVGPPLLVLMFLALLFWRLDAKERWRNQNQRGFEVKPTTGSEPVTDKKENDHG